MANTDSTTVTRLRGLLEVTRLMRDEQDVDRLLDAIARTIAQSLGYRTVVVNLYRPAWNHFEVTTVHGRPEAQAELLGDTLAWEAWAPLLDDRYRRGGAYLIAHGTFDWSDDVGRRYIPDIEPTDDPDAWHPDDELFVPLVHSDGHMLGILSVGEPVSGVRPSAAELEVLVAVAEHAALALQAAQENASSQAHRAALAELLQVSSRLTETLSADAVLQAICRGISGALGFQKVLLELPDPVTGVFESRASHGWQPEQLAENSPVSLWELAPLLDPPFEIEGCYLLPEHEALARLPAGHTAFRSRMNGSGPWAWDHHYLAVPLHDREGQVIGLIWSDDPADRLLPTRPMLQALRVFANQAAAALDSAGRFQEMRFLAEHDPLTRLLNRRAFTSRVQAEIARSQRHTHEFALVLLRPRRVQADQRPRGAPGRGRHPEPCRRHPGGRRADRGHGVSGGRRRVCPDPARDDGGGGAAGGRAALRRARRRRRPAALGQLRRGRLPPRRRRSRCPVPRRRCRDVHGQARRIGHPLRRLSRHLVTKTAIIGKGTRLGVQPERPRADAYR